MIWRNSVETTPRTCCCMVDWFADFFSHAIPAWEAGRIVGLFPAAVEIKFDLCSQWKSESRLQATTAAVEFRRHNRSLLDNRLQINIVDHAWAPASSVHKTSATLQLKNRVFNIGLQGEYCKQKLPATCVYITATCGNLFHEILNDYTKFISPRGIGKLCSYNQGTPICRRCLPGGSVDDFEKSQFVDDEMVMQIWKRTELLQMFEMTMAATQAVQRLVKFATALLMCSCDSSFQIVCRTIFNSSIFLFVSE